MNREQIGLNNRRALKLLWYEKREEEVLILSNRLVSAEGDQVTKAAALENST